MKKESIQNLYKDYYQRLIRFALTITKSRVDAEEVVHNVFRKLWDSEQETEIRSPYSYLIQCTKYEAFAHLKKEVKSKETNLRFLETDSDTQVEDDSELLATLMSAIAALPQKCQKVMRLKVEDGLTHKEISKYLNVSEKTIENQVSIAIKKIRKFFKGI